MIILIKNPLEREILKETIDLFSMDYIAKMADDAGLKISVEEIKSCICWFRNWRLETIYEGSLTINNESSKLSPFLFLLLCKFIIWSNFN